MHGLDVHTPVIPPTVPDEAELHFFNPLACYILDDLSKGQSMSKLTVDPTNSTTIKSLMSPAFQAFQPQTTSLPVAFCPSTPSAMSKHSVSIA